MNDFSNYEQQSKRLDYLISILLKETDYKIKIPNSLKEKHFIYKALCNMRSPNPLPKDFMKVESEYLQERLSASHITNVEDIKPLSVTHPFLIQTKKIKNLDKICLWKGDITKLKIDAIVNAGNSDGLGCFVPTHVCIDNQIHSEAGVGLRLECNEYMVKVGGKLNDGEAMITNAYNLPFKKVIQTVGPCLEGGYGPSKKQSSDLGECYTNSLKLLTENNLHSIAFPAISTGLYGFPKDQAAVIAIRKIDEYISEFNGNKDKIKVLLNVYDDSNLNVYEHVLKSYF
jgi:O-acetyl-ADP-ribose deacetylase (regulator of RNase III)